MRLCNQWPYLISGRCVYLYYFQLQSESWDSRGVLDPIAHALSTATCVNAWKSLLSRARKSVPADFPLQLMLGQEFVDLTEVLTALTRLSVVTAPEEPISDVPATVTLPVTNSPDSAYFLLDRKVRVV